MAGGVRASSDVFGRARMGLAVTAAILFIATIACDAAPSGGGSADPAAASPTAAATPTPKPDFDAGVILQEFPAGGPRNEVRLENTENGRFKARASIRMHRIENDDVNPVNIAFAQAGCTDCQTIAVAVQVVFYKRGATNVHPENVALAANVGCTRCVTAARAIQYVIPVDDPKSDVPPQVAQLIKDMDKELRFLASVKTIDQITSDAALARIQTVLDQYAELRQYLFDIMQIQRADNATPGPTGSASASPTASPTSAAPATSAPPSAPTATASPTATP
jgi:putative peptide zinc metalloprotease protein